MVVGVALVAGGAWAWMRTHDGCFGRCGEGTRCTDHKCLATGPAVTIAPPTDKTHRRRRHGAGGALGQAAPELKLQPGDERIVAQGDALGRPDHIDFRQGGDDGHELDQGELDRIMRNAEPEILKCITDAVGDWPLDSGKIEVGLRIERSGQVTRVRVSGPQLLQRNGLYRCVRGVVTALHFPASGGSTVATYPYELK